MRFHASVFPTGVEFLNRVSLAYSCLQARLIADRVYTAQRFSPKSRLMGGDVELAHSLTGGASDKKRGDIYSGTSILASLARPPPHPSTLQVLQVSAARTPVAG